MKVIAQFVDLENSQRSEPFSLDIANASETLNLLEDYINQEVKGKRDVGVLVVAEYNEQKEMAVSKAPIMKFEQFKKVMEQKNNG